jgi:hypothetical protein
MSNLYCVITKKHNWVSEPLGYKYQPADQKGQPRTILYFRKCVRCEVRDYPDNYIMLMYGERRL